MAKFLGVLLFLFLPFAAMADETGKFGSFVKDDLSAPGTVNRIADPTGSAPTSKVYSFSIPNGYCNPKLYDAATKESDCTWNSSRSQMRQSSKSQPKEAWYGWYTYFPANFAYGSRQTKGHYEFAYWHNHQCPHLSFTGGQNAENLYIETNKALGNYECEPRDLIKVANFKELLGRWVRFEVFVRWSNDSTGRVIVYLDGKKRAELKGATLTKGLESINYFKFGVYLCCTKDYRKIKGTSILFSGLREAMTREGLSVE